MVALLPVVLILEDDLHGIDERPQCRRDMAVAGVVKNQAGDWRTPLVQERDKLPRGQERMCKAIRNVGNALAVHCSLNEKVVVVQCELTWNVDRNLRPSSRKLPPIPLSAGQALADTGVSLEVVRRARGHSVLEITRRGNRYETDGAAELRGNHVLRHGFGQPYPGVKSLIDDVDEAPFRNEIDFDFRVAIEKMRNDAAKKNARAALVGVDPQNSTGRSAGLGERVERRVQILKNGVKTREQLRPCLREGHAARGAMEKPDTEFALESDDGMAQSRPRDAECLCGDAKIAMVGHRSE